MAEECILSKRPATYDSAQEKHKFFRDNKDYKFVSSEPDCAPDEFSFLRIQTAAALDALVDNPSITKEEIVEKLKFEVLLALETKSRHFANTVVLKEKNAALPVVDLTANDPEPEPEPRENGVAPTCHICLVNSACFIWNPCGHFGICEECYEILPRVNKCTVCKGATDHDCPLIKTFFA